MENIKKIRILKTVTIIIEILSIIFFVLLLLDAIYGNKNVYEQQIICIQAPCDAIKTYPHLFNSILLNICGIGLIINCFLLIIFAKLCYKFHSLKGENDLLGSYGESTSHKAVYPITNYGIIYAILIVINIILLIVGILMQLMR